MGPLGRSLLVLCVATSITTLCAQQGERVSDREAVALLLDAYNRESHDDYIFGLLETKPASDQAGRRILSFTVQETKCLKSENQNLDQCEFKEGGVVRNCKGEVSSERHLPVVVVSCDSVDAQGAQAQEESSDNVLAACRRDRHGRCRGRGRRKRGQRGGRRRGRQRGRQRGRRDVEREPSDTFPSRHGRTFSEDSFAPSFRRRPRPFPRPRPGPFPRPGPGPQPGPNFPGPQPGPNFPGPQPNPDFPGPQSDPDLP
ncbi:cathelicidin-3-like [Dromiciops gliroides]|uniref:cathelicidin-3-like n=1 Tax=Dromiciops gliroides TaxID=33562 RepID=UPI001CC61F5E|nr:cathelicidin-3-like [Dromiciops gliroides]